jgi:hypothetical protein
MPLALAFLDDFVPKLRDRHKPEHGTPRTDGRRRVH